MGAPKPPGATIWASVHLKGAGGWPEARRKAIALWLRRQARDLAKNGGNYAPKYVARYMRD